MVTARPEPLDVSLPDKSNQERADEEFVNGVLGLGSLTSRRTQNKFDSKYGTLTSPTGEVSGAKYLKTSFEVISRLPHQTGRSSAAATTTAVPSSTDTGVALLNSITRNRGRLHHHRHVAAIRREQEQHQHQHQQLEQTREEAIERSEMSAPPSDVASVASVGTSISYASTRVIKEPLRPGWMPLRAGKGMGTRRVQGAGLLNVAGGKSKGEVDTSLRDKYETRRPISRKNSPGDGHGALRGAVGRLGARVARPTSTAGGVVAATSVGGTATFDGIDNATGLRRIFKMHLHTLPPIESVKRLEDGFETAVLFRKSSRLTDAEQQQKFARLSALQEDASKFDNIERREVSDHSAKERARGEKLCGPMPEEIQSRFDRLVALAAHADKAGFR